MQALVADSVVAAAVKGPVVVRGLRATRTASWFQARLASLGGDIKTERLSGSRCIMDG